MNLFFSVCFFLCIYFGMISKGIAQQKSSDFSDLVPFVTTPLEVVEEILKLAEVNGDDVLYDLGSGDGRVPIAAARKFGAIGIGVEIDEELVRKARENAQQAGVADKVTFIQGDLFQMDLSGATVLFLYLFPDINLKLRPEIFKMRPGTRVISYRFDMGDWEPEQTLSIKLSEGTEQKLYMWRVPGSDPEAD